jgi:hypothetical protein
MIVRLKQIDPVAEDGPGSCAPSAEPSMIAEHANIPSPPAAGTNRRLRNWLIVANIVAWIVIIAAIRLIFF